LFSIRNPEVDARGFYFLILYFLFFIFHF